jgi:methylmalonyl-CoA/ethylmalonyl-CoA epimerase
MQRAIQIKNILSKRINLDLKFHHTGLIVDNIDEAVENYKLLFGAESISPKYFVSSQKVNVCFVNMGGDIFLELVESKDENSPIEKMRKKGHTYYHTAYLTNDIENSVKHLAELHYKPLDFFHSEAFQGKRCIFLFSPDAHLIELIEQ